MSLVELANRVAPDPDAHLPLERRIRLMLERAHARFERAIRDQNVQMFGSAADPEAWKRDRDVADPHLCVTGRWILLTYHSRRRC